MAKFTHATTFRLAHQFEINRLAAARMRARYLFDELNYYKSLKDSTLLLKVFSTQEMIKQIEELKYLDKRADRRKSKRTPSGINENMIENARNVPIESLIDFRYGKAYAWCHEDKRPSLSFWKAKNMATCWPCNRWFGPIDVLMDRDGLNFIEAVKALN